MAINEFEIEDGMLMEYYGAGGAVTVPEGVADIFFEVFEGMTSLTSVTLPHSLLSVTALEFSGCTALAEVTLSEGTEEIGACAFQNCTALEKITLPKTLVRIGALALAGCHALCEIRFGGSEREWSLLKKDTDWDKDTGAYRVICEK